MCSPYPFNSFVCQITFPAKISSTVLSLPFLHVRLRSITGYLLLPPWASIFTSSSLTEQVLEVCVWEVRSPSLYWATDIPCLTRWISGEYSHMGHYRMIYICCNWVSILWKCWVHILRNSTLIAILTSHSTLRNLCSWYIIVKCSSNPVT
jgi:hypothetical protein